MPNVQANFDKYQKRAQVGLEGSQHVEVRSRSNVGVVPIPFGVACGLAADDGCAAGAVGGAIFGGISLLNSGLDPLVGAAVDSYAQYDTVPLAREGRVWVSPITPVLANDPVYYDNVTGAFSNAAGAGKTLLSRAFFVDLAAIGELSRVDLNV